MTSQMHGESFAFFVWRTQVWDGWHPVPGPHKDRDENGNCARHCWCRKCWDCMQDATIIGGSIGYPGYP